MGYGLVYKIYTYNNEYLIGVLYSKIKKLVLFGILTLVVYECFCVFVLLRKCLIKYSLTIYLYLSL